MSKTKCTYFDAETKKFCCFARILSEIPRNIIFFNIKIYFFLYNINFFVKLACKSYLIPGKDNVSAQLTDEDEKRCEKN